MDYFHLMLGLRRNKWLVVSGKWQPKKETHAAQRGSFRQSFWQLTTNRLPLVTCHSPQL